jgi:hypothetical protein
MIKIDVVNFIVALGNALLSDFRFTVFIGVAIVSVRKIRRN